MNKSKTYLVLNYCGSPVAVNTRNDSFLIPGGTLAEPGTYPFTIEELSQINSASGIFRYGILFFEPEFEEDIYEELRIRNWKDILREDQVEEIILHPTMESLQKIVDIENDMYFERIYGIYIGMKNANYAIPGNSKSVIEAKNREMKAGKRHSAITLTKSNASENPELEAMKAEIEALKEQLLAQTNATETVKPKSAPKPAAKAPAKKTTTKPKSKAK